MGFLDSLEKLINEHGSAVILKERIALLNDRHADVERRLDAARQRCAELESANETLRAQIEALQAKVDEVRRLEQQADEQLERDGLPPDRVAVLKVVCFHPDMDAKQIAAIAGLGLQIAEWHLDQLLAARYVVDSITMPAPWTDGSREWQVTAIGREWLGSRGMLSG